MRVNSRSSKRLPAVALAVAGLATSTLLGCVEDRPESKLRAAADRAREARAAAAEEADDLRGELADLKAERHDVAQAQKKVSDASRQLSQATARLDDALAKLDAKASDVALFRAVQTALLEAEEIRDGAVSVSVRDRRVRLGGVVREAPDRERAIEIARSVPGVLRIEDSIEVRAGSASASAP